MKINSLIDPKKREEFRKRLLNPEFHKNKQAPEPIQPQKRAQPQPPANIDPAPKFPAPRGNSPRAPVHSGPYLDEQLRWAILKNDLSKVQKLVAGGMNPDLLSSTGAPALWFAAEMGYESICKFLIASKVNVNKACYVSGSVPLHAASRGGHAGIVKLLVSAGADARCKDHNDFTPLMWAVWNSRNTINAHKSIARLLISAGADLEARCLPEGETALTHAAMRGNMGMVEMLVSSGAQVNARDIRGKTPLGLAIENKHGGVARFLKERGGIE